MANPKQKPPSGELRVESVNIDSLIPDADNPRVNSSAMEVVAE